MYTATSYHYTLSWYNIFVFTSALLAFIYIVIAVVYFVNLANMVPPDITESRFMFIFGIIFALWYAAFIIIAAIEIAKPKKVVHHHDLLKESGVPTVSYPYDFTKPIYY
jgi:hypothetical protein